MSAIGIIVRTCLAFTFNCHVRARSSISNEAPSRLIRSEKAHYLSPDPAYVASHHDAGWEHRPNHQDLVLWDRKQLAEKLVQGVRGDFVLLDPKSGGDFAGNASDLQPIAEGTLSLVFFARKGTRRLALKVARNGWRGHRLGHECRRAHTIVRKASSRPGHRHLLSCSDDRSSGSPPFLVFPYAGDDGRSFLSRSPVAPAVVHGAVKQLMLALEALMIGKPPTMHRDLKWENTAVLSGGFGHCLRLLDFDSAVNGSQMALRIDTEQSYPPPEFRDVRTSCVKSDRQPCERALRAACGLVNTSASVCPLAHAYDIFMAGWMMVGSMCGVEEEAFAFLKQLDPQVAETLRNNSRHIGDPQSTAAARSAGFDYMLRSFTRGEVAVENITNMSTGAFFHRSPERTGEKIKAVAPELAESFLSKRRYCENFFQALPGSHEMLARMMDSRPERRPTPSEVLQSNLLQHVQTGCAWD